MSKTAKLMIEYRSRIGWRQSQRNRKEGEAGENWVTTKTQ